MSPEKKKICIVGVGGFAREVLCCLIDAIAGTGQKIQDVACFMVDKEYFKESKIMGVDVILQEDFEPSKYDVVVAIGDPALRRGKVAKMPPETTYTRIIHPSAIMSEWVEIGEGSIVTAGTILTCNIKIGKHAHLNLHTTVGHDCKMGDFFTSAPGANISGNCTFGECVYFGTNAAIREKVTVCDDVTIGMGGIVVKSIAEPGIYVGNPLRKLEK